MKIQSFSVLCLLALVFTVVDAGALIKIYELVDGYAMLLTRPLWKALLINQASKLACGSMLEKIGTYVPDGLGLVFNLDNATVERCTDAIDSYFTMYFSKGVGVLDDKYLWGGSITDQ